MMMKIGNDSLLLSLAVAVVIMPALLMNTTTMSSGVAAGWSWSRVPTSKAPKVSGQSVGSFKNQDNIVLFGGLTGPAGSPCTDETWLWKDNPGGGGGGGESGWTLLLAAEQPQTRATAARRPRVRMYGASAVLDGKMYLFGGWDPGAPGSGGEFLDDIWSFDPLTTKWHLMDIRLPYPVSRHTACTIVSAAPGNGSSSAENDSSSSIVLHTYKGTLVFQVTKEGLAAVVEKETTGDDGPDGLSMCAVSPLDTTKMLLFGGSTKTQQLSQDCYVLDCTEWVWTKLSNKIGDKVPPPLASACAAPLEDGHVLIFGGASIGPTGYEGGMGLIPQDETWHLEVQGNEAMWESVHTTNKPEGRVAASFCPTGPSRFVLQGGYDPLGKKTFEETWILDSDS